MEVWRFGGLEVLEVWKFGGLEVWRFGGLEMEWKHRRLEVWQEARELVRRIYGVSNNFPKTEKFGLADQINRAAVSVPSNIAEGSSRESPADFVHFLVIARGSLAEIDTQLTIAEDLGYVDCDEDLHALTETLARRINSLIRHVRTNNK